MPTVSKPCGYATAAVAERHTNSAQLTPAIPTREGGDSSQRQASEPPAWVLTDQLGEPRHRHWHWLTDPETWEPLIRAELHHPRRLRRIVHRLWPSRPPYGPDERRHLLSYGYSRREIEAICAAAREEAEAKRAALGSLRIRGAGR